MLKFGNKEFNNLQEQVLENANAIEEIKQGLGTALPNPIAGPQGPVGPQGPQGPQGQNVNFTVGTNLPATANTGDLHLKFNGELYVFTSLGWVLRTNLRGPQGPQGNTGPKGLIGPQGAKGDKGDQGIAGPIYKVIGKVDEETDLPDPSTVASNNAYIVGTDIYGKINNQWNNFGPLVTLEIASNISFVPYENLVSTNVQNAIEEVYETAIAADAVANEANNRSIDNESYIQEIDARVPSSLKLTGIDEAQFGTAVNMSAFTEGGTEFSDLDSFYNIYDTIVGVYINQKNVTNPSTGGLITLHKGEYVFRKVGCETAVGIDGNPYITHITYQTELSEYSERDLSLALRLTKNGSAIFVEPRYSISPEEGNMVNVAYDQTITGSKTFTKPIKLGPSATAVKITADNDNLAINSGEGNTFVKAGFPIIATRSPLGYAEYDLRNFASTSYINSKLGIWIPTGSPVSTTITSARGKSWECHYQVLKNTLTNKLKVEYTLYSLTEETATAELISFNLIATITIGASYVTDTIGYSSLPKPIEGDTYWTFDSFTFDESSDIGNQCTPLPFRGSGGFETRILVIDDTPPASITFKKVIANVSLYQK